MEARILRSVLWFLLLNFSAVNLTALYNNVALGAAAPGPPTATMASTFCALYHPATERSSS
jgi:hypothetical protein